MVTPSVDDAVRFVKEARAALKSNKKEAYNKALEGMTHDPLPTQAAELSRLAAEALAGMGEYTRARVYAKNSLDYARASGEYKLAFAAAMTMGNIFAGMNRYTAAEQLWSEAMMYAAVNNDSVRQGLSLLNMAMLDQRRGNHRRALNILEAVRRNLEGSKTARRPLAMCYGRFAFSYIVEKDYAKASEFTAKIEEMANQHKDKEIEAVASYWKGSIHEAREEFAESIPYYRKALGLYRELGNAKNTALILSDLAHVYVYLGEKSEVDSLLGEAMELAAKSDFSDVYSKVKTILGDEAVLRGNWEEARIYYHEALVKIETVNGEQRYQIIHNGLRRAIEEFGLNVKGLKELLREALTGYIRLELLREAKEAETWLSKIP